MIRNIFSFCFLLFSLTIFGQKSFQNSLTPEHQSVKGTKVSLIPPEGFVDAINFLGVQQTESGSSIMVMDLPGPYDFVSKGLTKENLLTKGIEVKKIEQLTINQRPALLVTGTQNAHGNIYTKYILVFGNDNEVIMLNGVYPENLKKIGAQVRKSMLSVYYDENIKLDPFATLDFSIDVSQTKLKFARNVSNSLIFTVDGQVPTVSADKTNLIAGKSFSQIVEEDKKLFSINRLKQLSVEIEKIEYAEEITIDGISGYAIFARAKSKKTGEPENTYQVILFSDKLYYILFGSTNDMTNSSIDDIKKAILTFRRK